MTSMNWSLPDVAAALSDLAVSQPSEVPSVQLTDVVIDSRAVVPDTLFICIRGERFDGHDFAEQVVKAGAAGLIVERKLDVVCPQWVVPNCREALGVLAGAWRAKHEINILAVVGSNGKTTTKEMAASICRQAVGADEVLVTAGNLNNDIGVPLTLLRMRPKHQLAVIEMGMNHVGEIPYLARIVRPDVVLLTNAQREHQEFMQSVEAVAKENGSAFQYLNDMGQAVWPAGTEFDALWASQANRAIRCLRFGEGGEAEVKHLRANLFQLVLGNQEKSFPARFIGKHNQTNAAGASLACQLLGITLSDIVSGLSEFHPVSGRLKVVRSDEELVVIDDSYNANPDSVRAAIDVLVTCSGTKILVLGDMGEVGLEAVECHREVVDYALESGINRVALLGELTASVKTNDKVVHFATHSEVISSLKAWTKEAPTSLLIKGSRFMKMEQVVTALTDETKGEHSGGAHAA